MHELYSQIPCKASDNKNTVREDETEILQEIERKVLPLLDVKEKTKKRI